MQSNVSNRKLLHLKAAALSITLCGHKVFPLFHNNEEKRPRKDWLLSTWACHLTLIKLQGRVQILSFTN